MRSLSPVAGSRTKTPRVALCFFGITRNFRRYAQNSIDEMLLDPVAKLDPSHKRFGHFNILNNVRNPRSQENNVPVDPDDYQSLNCKVVDCTDQECLDKDPRFQEALERLKTFGDSWGDNFNSLRNCLRQFHSLERVTNLIEKSNDRFDLVIYTRVDLHFMTKLAIPQIRSGTLYTPWFDKYRGLNDRFAMGDRATMLKYGRRPALALRYCEETGKPFHAERFLWWYARQQQLRTADLTSFEFCRVRAHGSLVRPSTTPVARLRYRLKRAFSSFRKLG